MAVVCAAELHGDFLLCEDVEDLALAGEIALGEDFSYEARHVFNVGLKRRGADDQLWREPLSAAGNLVNFREGGEVAQLALDDGVDFSGRMMRGVKLAKHHCQHAHVGQVLKGHAIEAEIAVCVGDAVLLNCVAQQRQGMAVLHAVCRLVGSIADVLDAELRKLCEVFGRVRGFLRGAENLDFAFDLREVFGGHRRGGLREALFEDGLPVVIGGNELDVCPMVVFQDELAQQLLEVAGVDLLAQALEGVVVTQVGGGELVAVEPTAHAAHGVEHAVGVAEVSLAHDELGM